MKRKDMRDATINFKDLGQALDVSLNNLQEMNVNIKFPTSYTINKHKS